MNGRWMDRREAEGQADSLGCGPTINDVCMFTYDNSTNHRQNSEGTQALVS